MRKEIAAAPPGFRLLLLIIQPAADGVMGVVDLEHEVGEGELQLMGPQLAAGIARREPEPRPEKQEDVRGLSDEPAAGFQKRRRKRGTREFGAVEELDQRRHAAALLFGQERDIKVFGRGFLQCQAHEFTASLYAGPVIELVNHAGTSELISKSGAIPANLKWPAGQDCAFA